VRARRTRQPRAEQALDDGHVVELLERKGTLPGEPLGVAPGDGVQRPAVRPAFVGQGLAQYRDSLGVVGFERFVAHERHFLNGGCQSPVAKVPPMTNSARRLFQ